jgi:hypothetical protein
MGFFLGGMPTANDHLQLEWGRTGDGRVTRIGASEVPADFASDARPELVTWRFYAAGSIPAAPEAANAVRFLVHSTTAPGALIALTAPVSYANEGLTRMLENERRPPLVLPNLAMYVPCAGQPRLSEGVAQPPGMIFGFRDSIWPLATGTSPFDEVTDLYGLTRFPLTDSADPPEEIAVYVVGEGIPRGIEARAEVTTSGGSQASPRR